MRSPPRSTFACRRATKTICWAPARRRPSFMFIASGEYGVFAPHAQLRLHVLQRQRQRSHGRCRDRSVACPAQDGNRPPAAAFRPERAGRNQLQLRVQCRAASAADARIRLHRANDSRRLSFRCRRSVVSEIASPGALLPEHLTPSRRPTSSSSGVTRKPARAENLNLLLGVVGGKVNIGRGCARQCWRALPFDQQRVAAKSHAVLQFRVRLLEH